MFHICNISFYFSAEVSRL